MPYLDIRCLTSSSLTPTSTIYYNNYNNTYLIPYKIRAILIDLLLKVKRLK
jgi:hypothetical protein